MSSLIFRLGAALLLAVLAVACQSHKADAPPTTNRLYSAMLDGLLKESVPFVSVAQLKTQPTSVLLDTRAPEEFAVSHLRGARWVGYESFSLAEMHDLSKNTPIVVYCSVGVRSEKIGAQLQRAGYAHVRNLYGGIFEWVNEGNPVFTAQGTLTGRVHAYSPAWGIWLKRGQKVYN